MGKETKEGQTEYCIACERIARHGTAHDIEHTCGIKPQSQHITKPDTESWEDRFKHTKFARGGGSCFECCDYEGMYDDLLVFLHQVEEKAYADGWENYRLMAREKRLYGGITEEFKRGRHSAYREIMSILDEIYLGQGRWTHSEKEPRLMTNTERKVVQKEILEIKNLLKSKLSQPE